MKEFKEVAVGHDQAGGEHHLGHVLEVAHGDEIFKAVGLAQGNRNRDNHRKTRIDGSGNEVRRKNRRVPARHDGHREIEAHNRVNGEHQRRGQAGQKQVRGLITLPVASRTAPAQTPAFRK